MGRKKLAPEIVADRARVGAALDERRKRAGLTPTELADALGISRPYLMNISAGRRPLTPELAAKASEVLGAEVVAA